MPTDRYARFPVALRIAKITVLVEVGVFLVVGVICWLGGWMTRPDVATVLFLVGVGVLGFGTFGLSGLGGGQGDWVYQYSRTASTQSGHDRAQQDLSDWIRSIPFFLVLFVAGLIAIVISMFIG